MYQGQPTDFSVTSYDAMVRGPCSLLRFYSSYIILNQTSRANSVLGVSSHACNRMPGDPNRSSFLRCLHRRNDHNTSPFIALASILELLLGVFLCYVWLDFWHGY